MTILRSSLAILPLLAFSLVRCAPARTAVPSPTGLPATATVAATPTPAAPTATPTRTDVPFIAGLTIRNLTVGALDRSYYLYVPHGFDPVKPIPVVMVFHGYTGEGAAMINDTEFNKLAEAETFLAVYPNGSGPTGELSWNAGGCCGSARESNVDESEFVSRILANLERYANVNSARIYATGLSNGAILSYRLACDMADTFAAVAPVAGTLFYDTCRPSQPVSVLHIHGDADTTVPFAGGNLNGLDWPPVVEGITAWVGFDQCEKTPQTEQDGMATRTIYSHCAAGTSVELILLQGVAHYWPKPIIWPTSQTVWDFFTAHPKKPA